MSAHTHTQIKESSQKSLVHGTYRRCTSTNSCITAHLDLWLHAFISYEYKSGLDVAKNHLLRLDLTDNAQQPIADLYPETDENLSFALQVFTQTSSNNLKGQKDTSR